MHQYVSEICPNIRSSRVHGFGFKISTTSVVHVSWTLDLSWTWTDLLLTVERSPTLASRTCFIFPLCIPWSRCKSSSEGGVRAWAVYGRFEVWNLKRLKVFPQYSNFKFYSKLCWRLKVWIETAIRECGNLSWRHRSIIFLMLYWNLVSWSMINRNMSKTIISKNTY